MRSGSDERPHRAYPGNADALRCWLQELLRAIVDCGFEHPSEGEDVLRLHDSGCEHAASHSDYLQAVLTAKAYRTCHDRELRMNLRSSTFCFAGLSVDTIARTRQHSCNWAQFLILMHHGRRPVRIRISH